MRISRRVLLSLWLVPVLAVAGVYTWTDTNGRVHFGDRPPPEAAAHPVEIKLNSYSGPPIVTIYQDYQRANAAGGKRVTIYTATWCGICKQATAYFRSRNIPFREFDVEKSAKGRKDFQRLGGRGVPVILVGDRRMNGFRKDSFDKLYRD